MIKENHEKIFVEFICKDKRSRYLDLVGREKGRKKLLDEMNTLSKYIDTGAILMELEYGSEDIVKEILRQRKSPDEVYVFSDENQYDQVIVGLDTAVSIAFDSSFVTIVSCIPGKLALVVSNESNERYVLYR